jgi:hypothetical protein
VCSLHSPLILKNGVAVKEQQVVWRLISVTIPPANFEAVREAALHTARSFPALLVRWRQFQNEFKLVLRPEFARDAPVFLTKVPLSDELAVSAIEQWLQAVCEKPELADQTAPIAELAFRLSPTDGLLSKAIFYSQENAVAGKH